METILTFLGFTTLESTVWNVIAYGFVVLLIVATLREKHRYEFFAAGATALAVYSGLFLHNTLFTTLQIVVMISALLQVYKVSPKKSRVTLSLLTLCALIFLFLSGNLETRLDILGALGLSGIAFGIVMLPRQSAFIVMALGGGFLTWYAFVIPVWAFFILNMFYTGANILQWNALRNAAPD